MDVFSGQSRESKHHNFIDNTHTPAPLITSRLCTVLTWWLMDISREQGNNVPSNITSESDGCPESSSQQTTSSGRIQYADQMLHGPQGFETLGSSFSLSR